MKNPVKRAVFKRAVIVNFAVTKIDNDNHRYLSFGAVLPPEEGSPGDPIPPTLVFYIDFGLDARGYKNPALKLGQKVMKAWAARTVVDITVTDPKNMRVTGISASRDDAPKRKASGSKG